MMTNAVMTHIHEILGKEREEDLNKMLRELGTMERAELLEALQGNDRNMVKRLLSYPDRTIEKLRTLAEKESTEDFQKFGGSEGLDISYTQTSLFTMVHKRAGWLVILFLSEMLTTTAMSYFDDEIAKAVVLALFVPLIISSGGNSGSQAASLIIRALALGEIGLRNWWMVMRKEILSGLLLGMTLGVIGFVRIWIWQYTGLYDYGRYWLLVACSVSVSLILIVLWGTLSGSMIPLILKRIGLDPATASAPFVATLVDVTGLIIYFTVSALFLTGKLL